MTALDAFAAAHRLTRDAYNKRIIAGKHGSLITDYGDGRLTVLLTGTRAKWWGNRRRTLIAAGCRLEQEGDTEGSLSFDPANVTASALALKTAGCRHRRRQSARQLANLRSDAKARRHVGGSIPRETHRPGRHPRARTVSRARVRAVFCGSVSIADGASKRPAVRRRDVGTQSPGFGSDETAT
jgi:hypothetical protein